MSIPYVADSPDHSLLIFQDQNHNHATNSDRKDWFLGNICGIVPYLPFLSSFWVKNSQLQDYGDAGN